jgi:hypothetical protein
MLAAPIAGASPRQGKPPARLVTAGHLAYLTSHNRVKLVTVKTTGHTSPPTRLGPVTRPPAHRIVQVEALFGSGDGRWLTWLEVVAKRDGSPTRTKPVLIVRDLKRDRVYRLPTRSFPIGFASDTVVVYGTRASRVLLRPAPHLVAVPGREYATAAYPQGVVDVKSTSAPAGPDRTDRLRLTSFDGTHVVVHSYLLAPGETRLPALTFVSADGEHLAVERGDHTDFGGIGPSSVLDEFSLAGAYPRSRLGHYGTARAAWRVGAVSFAWPSDDVWAVWERATAHGAISVVAVHRPAGWKSVLPHGIAVAGNRGGYVVAQPGKYVFASDGLRVSRVPDGDALLLHANSTRVLGIRGSRFVWVR